MYRLLLHPDIEKQLRRIPKTYGQRMVDAMRKLRQEPRPAHCKHLSGEMYRIREGEYRMIYAVFDDEQVVFVGKIARRTEKIYRDIAVLLAAARKAVDEK